MWYNRRDLVNQFEWQGAGLRPLNIFVCTRTCLDTPQPQLRAIVVSADPIPIRWPLTEPFDADEAGNSPPYGAPMSLEMGAVMPLAIGPTGVATHYAVPVAVLSAISNGTTTVSVTTRVAHGLSTNDQIAVEGLTQNAACGFYSVTVTTATAFTYQTLAAVPSDSLWQPASRMVTALVGLPRGQTTIVQV